MTRLKKVLIVDDNFSDSDLIQDVLRTYPCTLSSAVYGHEALVKVEVLPDLIILDLNLPDAFGLDILEKIKSLPHLKHIPVIIFSTSEDEGDIRQAYTLQASAFLTKPLDLDAFLACVRIIGDFWISWAKMV